MTNYTIYPSPFIVVDGNGNATKHYFAGSERIASRPVGYYDQEPQPAAPPRGGTEKDNGENSTAALQLHRLNSWLAEHKMPEVKYQPYNKEEAQKRALYQELSFIVNNLPQGEERQQALNLLTKGQLDALITLLKVEPNATKNSRNSNANIYYFHPDHLGTATFVSDANGEPYQFFLNLPFGELRSNREHLLKNKNNGEQTMAEQRAGSWEIQNKRTQTFNYYQNVAFCIREFQIKNNLIHEQNPYKFNGKELDAETGLYYYGARYYNPRWSTWLSVDPLADKYPHASPYNYCLNNPVIFVDPDGRKVSIYAGGKPILITAKDLASGTLNPVGLSGNDLKEFNTAYRALSFLYQTNSYATAIINELLNDNFSFQLMLTDLPSHFSQKYSIYSPNLIYWNSTQAIVNQYGKIITNPIQGLFHEIMHAFDYLINYLGIETTDYLKAADDFENCGNTCEDLAIFGENQVGSTRSGYTSSQDGSETYYSNYNVDPFQMTKMILTNRNYEPKRTVVTANF